MQNLSTGHNNTPCSDDVVGVTSEQSSTISGPGQRDTFWLPGLLSDGREFWLELINLALLLEVEDDDAGGSSGTEPVPVGGEDKRVDLITSIEGVEVLRLVEVPKHGSTILASGGAERSIRGDGDSVDVSGVSDVVGLDTARSQLPNLYAKSVSILFLKFDDIAR